VADRSSAFAVALLGPVIAILPACGESPIAPKAGALQGAWTYSAIGLTGVLPDIEAAQPGFNKYAATCSVSPTVMSLTHRGEMLAGTFVDAVVTCQLLSEGAFAGRNVSVETIGPVTGIVEAGTASGNGVSFNFVSASEGVREWKNVGEVGNDSTSGDVSITVVLFDQIVQLHGDWKAIRSR
jgi:hypothetical protein